MDIVIIVGPHAVGKMTVGEELEKRTGLSLLHNHMTIDLVLKFMPRDEGRDLITLIRNEIMKKVAKGKSKGMILTFIWAFEEQSDWDYIENIKSIFTDQNIYIVELNSDLETRLDRNITPNRLEKKWTKRNIEWSNNDVKEGVIKYRMTSYDGEIKEGKYLRIDNTNLSAIETADKIIEYFGIKEVV
ncbi:MAG: hypothetical protein KQ78_00659 [Candidatus Izimaplasma bacterium HR2]|nr:MAG: hypothetical protein KQ78_00659 [Candidatus Izimaplasma bacterium HR2]